jgi:UDP-N-acetyl-D-galactosamine dehydrogenase
VADLITELREYGCEVSVHDPIAQASEAQHEYGISLCPWDALPPADALVAAVSHRAYLERPLAEVLHTLKPGAVFVDIKSAWPAQAIRDAGLRLWRL